MRPLAFLFTRSFANGIRRAVTSPKRMLGVIFAATYYYFLAMRPLAPQHAAMRMPKSVPLFNLPPTSVLNAGIFAVMAAGSMVMLSSILSYRGGFRPADVDVLFPTPLNPKLVLLFRMVRDYLLTLLLPLAFVILGWRGSSIGIQELFRNYPHFGGQVLRMAWVAWMLMSLGWVSVGYGVSLLVHRSDVSSERNSKIINGSIAVLMIALFGYIGFHLRQDLSWAAAERLALSPFLRIAIFPASMATAVVMGSFQGNFGLLAAGLTGSLAIVVAGLGLAFSQVSWLYDQAAAKGFGAANLIKLRRSGDLFGVVAERARSGKLRRSKIAAALSGWRLTGAPALLWKEQLLQIRGSLSGTVFLGLIMVACNLSLIYLTRSARNFNTSSKGPGTVEILLPCLTAYMLSLVNANTGFVELLRRVDLLKPLPFSSSRIVFWEMVSKAPIVILISAVSGVAGLFLKPDLFIYVLTGIVFSSCLSLVITGSVLLSVVLFPDFDDPTQRGLRGLLMFLLILISSSPGAGLFFSMLMLTKLSPLICAIPGAAILVGTSLLLSAGSGALYAGFNPSE